MVKCSFKPTPPPTHTVWRQTLSNVKLTIQQSQQLHAVIGQLCAAEKVSWSSFPLSYFHPIPDTTISVPLQRCVKMCTVWLLNDALSPTAQWQLAFPSAGVNSVVEGNLVTNTHHKFICGIFFVQPEVHFPKVVCSWQWYVAKKSRKSSHLRVWNQMVILRTFTWFSF